MILEGHLNIFAVRNTNTLYFYVLTNRKLINNMQSTIEVEVWKWNDATN
jgi:hypothetical protein